MWRYSIVDIQKKKQPCNPNTHTSIKHNTRLRLLPLSVIKSRKPQDSGLWEDRKGGNVVHFLTRKRFSTFHKLTLCVLLCMLIFTATALVITRPSATQAAPATVKLSIQFTCAHAVDFHLGQVCIHTRANAKLTIKVTYCNGHSAVSKSLKGTQHADAKGNYIWNWTPQTRCRGEATVLITEHSKGHSASFSESFIVR